MSANQEVTVALERAPQDARVVENTLDGVLDAILVKRMAVARTEGEQRALQQCGKALDAAVERIDKAREEAARTLAAQSVALAVEIARQLVRIEVEAGRHDLEGMVREALAAADTGRAACVVHLHPLDAAALASVRFRAGTTIEADDSVQRGDVQVSTQQGLLVREVGQALRSIHERLLGELS